jgi:hypothetical protein
MIPYKQEKLEEHFIRFQKIILEWAKEHGYTEKDISIEIAEKEHNQNHTIVDYNITFYDDKLRTLWALMQSELTKLIQETLDIT